MIVALEKINKYVTLVTGILTLAFTVYFFYLNERLKAVGLELDNTNKKIVNLSETVKLELDKKRFTNDIRFKIFSEVKDAMGKVSDGKAQKATKAIIDIMLVEDLDFRNKMYDIMSVNPNADSSVTNTIVKTLMTEKVLNEEFNQNSVMKLSEMNEQQKVKPTIQTKPVEKGTNNFIKVDVFYLEDILKEAEPRAQQIVDMLNSTTPLKYKARKRILPRSINAKEGYRIGSNQIRFETDEKSMANDILNLIDKAKVFQLEQPSMELIDFKTPNYISVFVRNM